MRALIQCLLIAALAFTGVNLMVGCAPKKDRGVGSGLNQKGRPGAGTTASGTSDSGGCDGVNNKCFESYRVDPTQLPAYKEHIEGIFNNIVSSDPNEKLEPHKFFKTKMWYIAPVKFKKNSKEVLGVSFIKSQVDPIARQTIKEVWISKDKFDAMENTREQAETILHEWVMGLYFFKYIKTSDVCKLVIVASLGEARKEDDCANPPKNLDQLMPAEKMRPLNREDYANIRFVTGWLMQNGHKPIAENDFLRLLHAKNFDKRFFNPDTPEVSSDNIPEIQASYKEIIEAIQGAALTGHMPNICQAYSKGETRDCRLEFSETELKVNRTVVPGFTLTVYLNNKPTIRVLSPVGPQVKLESSINSDGKIFYSLPIGDWPERVKVGDRLYSGYIIFSRDTSGPAPTLNVESVILRPGIVVSIDKKRDPVCIAKAPNALMFTDDAIIARRMTELLSVVEILFFEIPIWASCSSEINPESK